MGQDANDSLWDPRPRLRKEAEHVNGVDEPPGQQEDIGKEDRAAAQEGASEPVSALVELAPTPDLSAAGALEWARGLRRRGIEVDEEFGAIQLRSSGEPQTFCVRVIVPESRALAELEADPRVLKVWGDTQIAPFTPE